MTQGTLDPRPTVVAAPASPAAPIPAVARPGLLLGLVLVGQFMALLDVSIVNVAAPTLRNDLHSSDAGLQLVIGGYTIAYAVLLVTGARLGERLGYSRTFRAGLAAFALASLACGLAPSTGALVGFRLVQGAAAALMVPQVMSLIQRTFTGAARVKALGAYTAVLAGGMVAGQVLGGVLVSADIAGSGWRPVFLVNVPIGLVLFVVAGRALPADEPNETRTFDVAGLLLLSCTVFLFVLPLVLGHEEHWPLWGWLMLAGSAVLGLAFAATQRRLAETGGHPLIHRRVVQSPGLVPAAASIFLIMAGVGGFLFALTLHLQEGLGDSPLRAGLTFAPTAVGFGLSGLHWRRIPERFHGRLPLVATGLAILCYLGVAVLLRDGYGISAGTEVLLFVLGTVSGCSYGPLFAQALARVEPRDAADASGVVVTVVQLGQVVGVATLGTLFLSSAKGFAPSDSGHAIALTACGVAVLLAVSALPVGLWLLFGRRAGAPADRQTVR